ncbi:MAG TPA: hypothetical protein DD730_11420 [Desulfosporosinus sp.]|nr:hypothetical protein [Desulfosporosinus sp.]
MRQPDVKDDALIDALEQYFVERTLPMRRGLGVQIDATIWQWLDNTYRGLKIPKVELIEKALTQVLPVKFKP